MSSVLHGKHSPTSPHCRLPLTTVPPAPRPLPACCAGFRQLDAHHCQVLLRDCGWRLVVHAWQGGLLWRRGEAARLLSLPSLPDSALLPPVNGGAPCEPPASPAECPCRQALPRPCVLPGLQATLTKLTLLNSARGTIPVVSFGNVSSSSRATVMTYSSSLSRWDAVGQAGFSTGAHLPAGCGSGASEGRLPGGASTAGI